MYVIVKLIVSWTNFLMEIHLRRYTFEFCPAPPKKFDYAVFLSEISPRFIFFSVWSHDHLSLLVIFHAPHDHLSLLVLCLLILFFPFAFAIITVVHNKNLPTTAPNLAGAGAEGADDLLPRIGLDPVHRVAVSGRPGGPHRKWIIHIGYSTSRRDEGRHPGGWTGESPGNIYFQSKYTVNQETGA